MKNPLRTLSYEQLRLLAQCSCTLAIAAILAYGLLPQYRAQQALQTQIAMHKQQLRGPTIKQSDLEALTRENEVLRIALSGGKDPMPPREIESRVLQQLHAQAQQAGVRLSKVQPERDTRDDGLLVLQFDVEAVGSYSQCARWLEALDGEQSIAVLSSFTWQPEDAQGERLRTKSRILSYHRLGGSV
ncbi:MAG: type 4a pilus biogenesis protein PilO [Pseudomonadales bacterium]